MEEKIEGLIQRYKKLKQYNHLSDEELREIVRKKLEEKEEEKGLGDELDIEEMFTDKDEKKEAKKLLRKYLNTYSIETISERNTLKQLVFLEVFNNRLQKELNKYHDNSQPSPPKTVESLHSNLNQISSLKDKLGLSKDKKEKTLNEGYNVLDTLFKKWKIWREENQGSRVLSCPHCGKMILLKIRTDAWEAQKHPFFKDRILANTHLMEMYRVGRISKHDVARVLNTSLDYVDWLIDKIYYKEFNKLVPKELEEQELESGQIEQNIG